jgi:hypothetical protein
MTKMFAIGGGLALALAFSPLGPEGASGLALNTAQAQELSVCGDPQFEYIDGNEKSVYCPYQPSIAQRDFYTRPNSGGTWSLSNSTTLDCTDFRS